MTREALHPHKMQSIPPLTSHWKNLVISRLIIASIIIFVLRQRDLLFFARIEEDDTILEIYFREGPQGRGED